MPGARGKYKVRRRIRYLNAQSRKLEGDVGNSRIFVVVTALGGQFGQVRPLR